jgi:hypothetical protein
MSSRDDIIIAIQDNVADLNTFTLFLGASICFFFVSLVLAFIMRKELKASLENNVFTPTSKIPGRFRTLFFGFLGLAFLSLISSGFWFLKSQDMKTILADQKLMLEKTVKDDRRAQAEREKIKPITSEEINMIKADVESDLKNIHTRLQKEAEARAAKNPNTTVEAEFKKLIAEYDGPVVTDRPIPEHPTHDQLKQQADKDVNTLITSILEEPVRQLDAEKEKAK